MAVTTGLAFGGGKPHTAHKMSQSASQIAFLCDECGHNPAKWAGQCPRCGTWNSIREYREPRGAKPRGQSRPGPQNAMLPQRLGQIPRESRPRAVTGITELDRPLGGGVVPGSTILIAGNPGIGKSTLALQLACAVAGQGGSVLYATGEESAEQIAARAARLGARPDSLFVVPTGNVFEISSHARELKASLVVVDSAQTAWNPEVDSSPGTVSQVRESAAHLSAFARETNASVVLTGHVTKDGGIAGPKVLEHMVDVVMYMDGESGSQLRVLRATKNRYGAIDEIGLFEMREDGLASVDDPSAVFLGQRRPDVPGSAVTTVLEGTRLLTLEVQALVTPSSLAAPRRVATGYDPSRLQLICAVLGKRLHLPLSGQDVVVNVAGGLRIRDTAADAAVALAIVSSLLDRPVARDIVACGEIGLAGELRGVSQARNRVAEATRLGFRACLLPDGSADFEATNCDLRPVRNIAEAVDMALVATEREPDAAVPVR